MNYTLIIIGFIVLVGIYMLYQYFTNTTLTSGVVDLANQTEYKHDTLKSPASKIYSLAGWIFMTGQTDDGTGGFIFHRAATSTTNPNVNNPINFGLKFQGTTLEFYGGSSSNALFNITNQVPLQKWVYVVININGDLVEVYLNGKIVKTVKLNDGILTSIFSATASLFVGNNKIKGYITKFSMNPQLIDAATVWKNYLSGNGLSNQFLNYFMPYNINMAITKDDVLERQFSIF